MQLFTMPVDQLLKRLQTDRENGLTKAAAETLLCQKGENKLQQKRPKTLVERFFDQFRDAMILILLLAAAISFIVALGGHDKNEFFEPLLILLIVILNAVMGVVQESRAQKALDALAKLSAPHARVVREGKEHIVDSALLVPGDIILVEAGDFVPADARLLQSASLKVEESALTGESVPAEKDANAPVAQDAALGDRTNMIYSGCPVAYGNGKAVVTATGMDTEMGKIAGLLGREQEVQTPLQQKLTKLGKQLGFLAIGICAVIFVIGIVEKMPVMEIFMISVSLAVSAIPEGLPAIVTIVLSIGVSRMVKKNAIIRRLPAVETLGGASVICSDKTGTLTQNRMTLTDACLPSGKEEQIGSENSEGIVNLLRYGTLCCDGSILIEGEEIRHIGDPTETAIVFAAHRHQIDKKALSTQFPRVAALPFDSNRKRMSVVVEIEGRLTVITKGAFDSIESCCRSDLSKLTQKVEEMSGRALRVLAVACKQIEALPVPLIPETLECDLEMMGIVGMIDPPRPEAKEAVAVCRRAGIRPVMITGDHVITASAIAREIGILQQGDRAMTGAELAKLSEPQLDDCVRSISVYARVSPEDKIRIVKAWQRQGEVVSMTGDGVNDAPALKAADIGCAMGITGTDVAKGAADMTLTDDNFATIVDAVREGRGIYDNIKKAVVFLLGTNIGEVFTVLFAMLFFRQAPLLSMQLLWINLVTDSLPAVALGMEKLEAGAMEKPPRPKNEGLFAHGMGLRVVLQGALFAVLTLAGFVVGLQAEGIGAARTMAFMVLAFTQIVHSFNMRSDSSLFKIGFFTNRYLNAAAAVSIALTVSVVFLPPVATAFGLVLLPSRLYTIALGLSLIPLPVLELVKAVGLIRVHHHR